VRRFSSGERAQTPPEIDAPATLRLLSFSPPSYLRLPRRAAPLGRTSCPHCVLSLRTPIEGGKHSARAIILILPTKGEPPRERHRKGYKPRPLQVLRGPSVWVGQRNGRDRGRERETGIAGSAGGEDEEAGGRPTASLP
jgi:hypothetical protein